MVSNLLSEIKEKCDIIVSKNSPIVNENRISDFITVRAAFKLRDKEVPKTTLKQLYSRMKEPHTDEEVDKIFEGVKKVCDIVFEELKKEKVLLTAELPEYLYYDNYGKLRIEMKKYARYLQNTLNIIYYPVADELFVYDNKSHCYRKESIGNKIDIAILKLLEEKDMDSSRLIYISEEIDKHLKSMENQEKYPFNTSTDTIPVKNGVLKLDYKNDTITLLPHGPEHHFNYTMNAEWKEGEDGEAAKNLIRQWVDEKNVNDIIQIPAQAIVQKQVCKQLKRATLLIGIPNTGKSKIIHFIRSTMGAQYVSAVSLQSMSTDRFCTGNLETATLNIKDELSNVGLTSVDKFKDLTGGVYSDIERKGKQPYPGIITCGWMFTCNFPPTVMEKIKRDTAFWKRWNVIVLHNVFPETTVEDDDGAIVTDEIRSSFLKCIVDMVMEIHKRKKLISEHSVSEVMTEWISHCDSVVDFIDNAGFVPSTNGEPIYYVKENLHNIYQQYCIGAGFDIKLIITNKNSFYALMQNHGFIPFQYNYRKSDGKRVSLETFRSWKLPAGERNKTDGHYYIKTDDDKFGEINPISHAVFENVINKVDISQITK